MEKIIDGVGDSYTKLLLLLSEAGEFVYEGMKALFTAVFYTSVEDLLETFSNIPGIGLVAEVIQLIFGIFGDEVLKDITLFQLMIGPLCVMVVVFTIVKWLKDLT